MFHLLKRLKTMSSKSLTTIILIEVFSVFFSILLAFSFNNWREDSRNRSLADLALNNCLTEIGDNLLTLENVTVSHDSLRKKLAAVFEENWNSNSGDRGTRSAYLMLSDILKTQQFELLILSDIAWQTALGTGAMNHMDFQVASDLAEIYGLQQGPLRKNNDLIMEIIFNPDLFNINKNKELIMTLTVLLFDVQNKENEMADMYREFIATHSDNTHISEISDSTTKNE